MAEPPRLTAPCPVCASGNERVGGQGIQTLSGLGSVPDDDRVGSEGYVCIRCGRRVSTPASTEKAPRP